jgi:hypothetical protein
MNLYIKATVEPISAIGWRHAWNKTRISNIEHGMLNAEAVRQRKILHHSNFHVRYSIFLQGAWQVYYSRMTDREELAKHLPTEPIRTSISITVIPKTTGMHEQRSCKKAISRTQRKYSGFSSSAPNREGFAC